MHGPIWKIEMRPRPFRELAHVLGSCSRIARSLALLEADLKMDTKQRGLHQSCQLGENKPKGQPPRQALDGAGIFTCDEALDLWLGCACLTKCAVEDDTWSAARRVGAVVQQHRLVADEGFLLRRCDTLFVR